MILDRHGQINKPVEEARRQGETAGLSVNRTAEGLWICDGLAYGQVGCPWIGQGTRERALFHFSRLSGHFSGGDGRGRSAVPSLPRGRPG